MIDRDVEDDRPTLRPGAVERIAHGAVRPIDPPERDLFDSTTDGRGGRDISTTETFGSGSPDVVVTAHVGIGQILIGKEQ